jgi:hypothetical protein
VVGVSEEYETRVASFVIDIRGGWNYIWGERFVEFTDEPVKAWFYMAKTGAEPPFAGSTKVYVDGLALTYDNLGKEYEIAPRRKYTVRVEKNGFGWVGDCAVSGYIKAVFKKRLFSKPEEKVYARRVFPEIPWYVWVVAGIFGFIILLVLLPTIVSRVSK